MEADPAQIKVAIRADERIGIRKGGAHLELKFDAADGSLHVDETYVIEIIRNPIITPELVEAKQPGDAVTVLQLSTNDARKMKHIQSLFRPFREDDRKGTGSLGVSVNGVCTHSPIPAGEVLVDIFLQTSNNDGYFVITRNLDLRESRDGVDAKLEKWTKCEQRPINSGRNNERRPHSSQHYVTPEMAYFGLNEMRRA
ncbi:MAG: hypothetical protein ACR2P1_03115 [Pseudomonadales bacterium]